MTEPTPNLPRCAWAQTHPLNAEYHDEEWGVPEYDSRALWEKLILDGFQAGLSWLTILKKRDAFREAFEGFDPVRIADYDEHDIERLMGNAGIIRSRSKIEATIGNARAYLAMRDNGEDFSEFLWSMVGGRPIQRDFERDGPVPTQTPLSLEISKALKKRGFKFAGPVIVYAWMQAVGMINDHADACHRRKPVEAMG
ncbi:DNA-3-methyladenine glycosylase I [Salinicola acroporae]|uniref:DNA-3-methyladenine glycosylase I n=1 Tax=Salinicola acroporae TaxID=1541440 RepID=A0ABT6I7N4_9GAMM|nr:DNA-3-methyladenine glycosylase I [Salinicola acroporae]MDH4573767.1 DNA-3-methyladenine glycosylase I [Salinicola acroporae]